MDEDGGDTSGGDDQNTITSAAGDNEVGSLAHIDSLTQLMIAFVGRRP